MGASPDPPTHPTLTGTQAGAVNFFAFDLATNFFADDRVFQGLGRSPALTDGSFHLELDQSIQLYRILHG